MWDYKKTLKVKYLQVKELCSRKIKTKELFVDGVKIFPNYGTTTARSTLTTIPLPETSVLVKNVLEFSGIYALPATTLSNTVQTFSYQFAIDNNPLKLEDLNIVTTLGYSQQNGNLYLYNPTTRNWEVPGAQALTPFVLNSLNYINPPDEKLNIPNTISLSSSEICDVHFKQQQVGSTTQIFVAIWVNAIFAQGPFEPTIETQYSATYINNLNIVCQ